MLCDKRNLKIDKQTVLNDLLGVPHHVSNVMHDKIPKDNQLHDMTQEQRIPRCQIPLEAKFLITCEEYEANKDAGYEHAHDEVDRERLHLPCFNLSSIQTFF